jgi:hypothetical protein
MKFLKIRKKSFELFSLDLLVFFKIFLENRTIASYLVVARSFDQG